MKIIDMAKNRVWGSSIYFLNYQERRVTGHLTPKPEVGDKLKIEMKPAGQGRYFKLFTFKKVEDFFDPPDQFFADVVDSGFILENNGERLTVNLGERCPFCRKKFKKDFQHLASHMEKKHIEEIEKY